MGKYIFDNSAFIDVGSKIGQTNWGAPSEFDYTRAADAKEWHGIRQEKKCNEMVN